MTYLPMPGFHEVFLWSRLMAIAANVQQAGPFLYSNDTYNNDRHSPGFRILVTLAVSRVGIPEILYQHSPRQTALY